MNRNVSFEMAELLEKNGFIENCKYYYFRESPLEVIESYYSENHNNVSVSIISAPLIADVIMWIYNKYQTWIHIWTDNLETFFWSIETFDPTVVSDDDFESPNIAFEKGIEWFLTQIVSKKIED